MAVSAIVPKRFSYSGKQIPYESTISLATTDNTVKKLVFVIHGTNRNADDYYLYATAGVTKTGQQNVVVIAPQFLMDEDLTAFSLSTSTYFRWSNDGWKSGNLDQGSGPSSYSVLDALILSALQAFPSVTHVTVTGHSAGGQFVNRFAAGSNVEGQTSNILFKYDSMNPSSYMYFSKERPVGRSTTTFAIPVAPEGDYNNYKYGLRNLNTFMTTVGTTKLRDNFGTRDVNLVLGMADTERDSDLDVSVPGEYQGYNRLERGQAYFNHMNKEFANIRFNVVYVPGVAHSANQMYSSDNGSAEIFNHTSPVIPAPPPEIIQPEEEEVVVESFLRYKKPWR
jgi:hypothetical protein